jgi:hypothetical protein
MRTFFLIFVLLAVPAAAAAQEGPRRGRSVPARAVREAEAARVAHERARAAARNATPEARPVRPAKQPSGG